MVEYKEELEKAWGYLTEEYKAGKFKPEKEADIQCFLYHALISCGIPSEEIRAEYPYQTEKRGKEITAEADIHLGDGTGEGVYIEIKKSRNRNRRDTPKRWSKDLNKLKCAKLSQAAVRIFIIFVFNEEKETNTKDKIRGVIEENKGEVTILGFDGENMVV
jgi:hypothetical protein